MIKNTLIVVTGTGLGKTQPEDSSFGSEMLGKFLRTVESRDDLPRAICFYTEGVKNVDAASPHLEVLKELGEQGVEVVACKTCLSYFGIEDRVAVGRVSGMDEIVSLMADADKIITV